MHEPDAGTIHFAAWLTRDQVDRDANYDNDEDGERRVGTEPVPGNDVLE